MPCKCPFGLQHVEPFPSIVGVSTTVSIAAPTWIDWISGDLHGHGGSGMNRSPDILPRVQHYVHKHARTPGRTVPLRASLFGTDAALLGAIPLVEACL